DGVGVSRPGRAAARRPRGGGVSGNAPPRGSPPVARSGPIGIYENSKKNACVLSRQFTVPARGPEPRVQLAGQTATSDTRVSTPRPALMDTLNFGVVIRGRTGPATGLSLTLIGDPGSGLDVAVAPADLAPETGHLQTFTQVQMVSPRGASPPYEYNLDFPGPPDRIPGPQPTVQPSGLATVTENYFQDRPSAGFWATLGGTVPEFETGGSLIQPEPQRIPGQRIQYVTADPSVVWFSDYVAFGNSFGPGLSGPRRPYRPGEAAHKNLTRYPLPPAPAASPPAGPAARIQGLELPSAARAGDVLTMAVGPFSDSTPGHFGQVGDDPTS